MYRISRVIQRNQRSLDLFKKRLEKQNACCSIILSSTTTAVKVEEESQKLQQLFPKREEFPSRHIGPREHEQTEMLELLGFRTLDEMTDKAVPAKIRLNRDLEIEAPVGKICNYVKLGCINKVVLHIDHVM
ncbi:hypothetical protein C0J52_01903 [Blattella germanica]|nr:hypothetical protein C0J52_01903 [Blattella germanica]